MGICGPLWNYCASKETKQLRILTCMDYHNWDWGVMSYGTGQRCVPAFLSYGTGQMCVTAFLNYDTRQRCETVLLSYGTGQRCETVFLRYGTGVRQYI